MLGSNPKNDFGEKIKEIYAKHLREGDKDMGECVGQNIKPEDGDYPLSPILKIPYWRTDTRGNYVQSCSSVGMEGANENIETCVRDPKATGPRRVVLKQINSESMIREYSITSALKRVEDLKKNVVSLSGVCDTRGKMYEYKSMVFGYHPQDFVNKLIKYKGVNENQVKLDGFLKAAESIGKIHKYGFFHYDLKPGNILSKIKIVKETRQIAAADPYENPIETVLLIDWDISRNTADTSLKDWNKYATDDGGYPLGTEPYISSERFYLSYLEPGSYPFGEQENPEVEVLYSTFIGKIESNNNLTKSDVFSLGLILINLVCGELAFVRPTAAAAAAGRIYLMEKVDGWQGNAMSNRMQSWTLAILYYTLFFKKEHNESEFSNALIRVGESISDSSAVDKGVEVTAASDAVNAASDAVLAVGDKGTDLAALQDAKEAAVNNLSRKKRDLAFEEERRANQHKNFAQTSGFLPDTEDYALLEKVITFEEGNEITDEERDTILKIIEDNYIFNRLVDALIEERTIDNELGKIIKGMVHINFLKRSSIEDVLTQLKTYLEFNNYETSVDDIILGLKTKLLEKEEVHIEEGGGKTRRKKRKTRRKKRKTRRKKRKSRRTKRKSKRKKRKSKRTKRKR